MLKRTDIRKKQSINLGGFICLAAAVYCIYYLLVKDDFLSLCASTVLSWRHLHIMAIALIPIYVAFLIFGAAILSSYFGSALHRWLRKKWNT